MVVRDGAGEARRLGGRYISLHRRTVTDLLWELGDHRHLVALARTGDVEGGVAAMCEHIARVTGNLEAVIN